MYGHQIRRDAGVDRTELWSEVKPGSLYSALHRLEAEGLIEYVRTEQQGNLPARTVYAITSEGRGELRALSAEALREVTLRPDPVDLALAMSADLDEDALRGYFASRREALSSRAAFLADERERAWPGHAPADDLIIQQANVTARAVNDPPGELAGPEGCPSPPGLTADTLRAMHTTVTGVDRQGDPVTVAGTGELSRVLQHETDHLRGVLFIDRLSGQRRKDALAQIRRAAHVP